MPPRELWTPHFQQQPVYSQQQYPMGNPAPQGLPPKVAPPQPPVKSEPVKSKNKTVFWILMGLVGLGVVAFVTTLIIFLLR